MEYGNGETNNLVWKSPENRYHNEEIEEVTLDNDNVNISVLGRLVDEGSVVLDIGCGEGKFGYMLQKKGCKVYGVELDKTAAEYAIEHRGYTDVFCFNAERPEGGEWDRLLGSGVKFDYIALLDVLEHVINPTAVILNAVKLLKDGGNFLFSVPNVNNGDIFLNLLRDHFNYRESGVLDNTHTKYFTKNSFVEWLKEVNEEYSFSLDCRYVGSIYAYTDYMEQVKAEYPAVYEFIQQNPSFHVMQHLFISRYSVDGSQPTADLDALLQDAPMDLTPILEKWLQSPAEADVPPVQLLANERKIMEEQITVANKGWQEAAAAIDEARVYGEQCEKNIAELKEYNAKLESYISQKESDITELKGYNAKLEGDIAELKEYITKLEGDMATLTSGPMGKLLKQKLK